MPNPIQVFLVLATCGASLLLAAGFLGRFHGLGDSLAVYRTALSCLLLVLAILLAAIGLRWPGALAGSFAALALITVLSHWWPAPGQAAAAGPGVTVYQKNLWTRLATPEAMVTEILASGADVVTLQEVGRRAAPVLEGLRDAYPTQVVCPYATVGGVAVLSRFPERPGSRDCVPLSGLVSTVLETPDGPSGPQPSTSSGPGPATSAARSPRCWTVSRAGPNPPSSAVTSTPYAGPGRSAKSPAPPAPGRSDRPGSHSGTAASSSLWGSTTSSPPAGRGQPNSAPLPGLTTTACWPGCRREKDRRRYAPFGFVTGRNTRIITPLVTICEQRRPAPATVAALLTVSTPAELPEHFLPFKGFK